ncbi:MAG: ATP-dependent helicase [Chlorobi bacterium]|nr:ATP-dependent helicase [Chlorobiota bacterium]
MLRFMPDNLDSLLDRLDPEMRRIIEHPKSSVVIACPGAGKTSLLKYRFAYLISNGISPENIVLVTFSNRAANRLKREVIDVFKQLGYEGIIDKLQISTFHSLCVSVINESPETFGLKKHFSIYDETDQEKLISIIVRHLQKEWNPSIDYTIIDEYIKKISELKVSKCLSPIEAYDDILSDYLFPPLAEVYDLYELVLKHSNATDFDGLIVKVYNALGSEEFKNKFSHKFKHILVDEYQDFTLLQHILFLKLSKFSETFMVVGDPAQNIYSFRHASPKYLMDLANYTGDLVPNMIKSKPDVFYMNRTKRLTKDMVRAANNLLEKTFASPPYKILHQKEEEGKVAAYCFDTPEEEFKFVAKDIETKVKNGAFYSDIAILSRNRFILNKLANYLTMPYVKLFPEIVGYNKFHRSVEALISALKVIINPKDNLSWHKIYEEYVSGRRDEDDEVLTPKALDEYLMATVLRGDDKPFVKDPDFMFSRTKFSTSEQIFSFLDKWGIELVLSGQKKELLITRDSIVSIIENIAKFIRAPKEAVEHVKKLIDEVFNLHYSYYGTYPEFPEVVSALSVSSSYLEELLKAGREGQKIDRVHLLTIHGAKGLEFKHVYLIGMRDGNFPSELLILQDDPRRVDYTEEMKEERRVCFVGITRAKETLTLTFSKQQYSDHGWMDGESDEYDIACEEFKSRFISDMEIPVQTHGGCDDLDTMDLPF